IALGYFSYFLSLIFGFIAYLIMNLMIFLVSFFAAVPLASVSLNWFDWWMAGIYYFWVAMWIIGRL
ncbi:hypothetical protein KBC97_02635, partial [Candidatus Gracilibacteria bacterium]|nr:hypothetical protein [Candidatus Gracilibacteria bacterium]